MDRTQGYHHELETESPSARASRQWHSIQAVVEKALSFEGEFRERLASAGIVADEIRSLDDFTSIPVLRKKELSRCSAKGAVLVSVLHPRTAFAHLSVPRPHLRSRRPGRGLLGLGRSLLRGGLQVRRPGADDLQLPPHPGRTDA
jgi:hypothetical protein